MPPRPSLIATSDQKTLAAATDRARLPAAVGGPTHAIISRADPTAATTRKNPGLGRCSGRSYLAGPRLGQGAQCLMPVLVPGSGHLAGHLQPHLDQRDARRRISLARRLLRRLRAVRLGSVPLTHGPPGTIAACACWLVDLPGVFASPHAPARKVGARWTA